LPAPVPSPRNQPWRKRTAFGAPSGAAETMSGLVDRPRSGQMAALGLTGMDHAFELSVRQQAVKDDIGREMRPVGGRAWAARPRGALSLDPAGSNRSRPPSASDGAGLAAPIGTPASYAPVHLRRSTRPRHYPIRSSRVDWRATAEVCHDSAATRRCAAPWPITVPARRHRQNVHKRQARPAASSACPPTPLVW